MRQNDIVLAENQLQLVTFEQAKRLKATGFDWYTDFSFINEDIVRRIGRSNAEVADRAGEFCAPAVALALKWFRDVKGYVYDVLVSAHREHKTISYLIWWANQDIIELRSDFEDCGSFATLEDAESALLDALLYSLDGK